MKKFLIITCTALIVLTGCAYPRQTNNALAAGKIRAVPKNQYLNDIHIRAVRDFVSRFGDISDVIWHRSDKHYIAVFIKDSVQTRVIYNLSGNMEYTMKYYEEPKMRRDIRALVKSTYYDYKIFIIQEIQKADDQPVYIVNLQGDTEWMKVKVYNGEMEVMEKFKKGRK
jgi:hypothetical protein